MASPSSTLPTSTRSVVTSRRSAAPRRSSAAGCAGGGSSSCSPPSASARWVRTRGTPGNSRRHIMDAVDASLRRLQTDWIDLYQLHFNDPGHADRRDTRRARRSRARGQGSLRRLFELPRVPTGTRASAAARCADSCGSNPCSRATTCCSVSSSARCSRCVSTRASASSPTTRSRAACSPGSTTGPNHRSRATGSRSARRARCTRIGTGTRTCSTRSNSSRSWRSRRGCRSPTLAVAWVLAHPAVTSPIIGASRPEQLDATLAAVDTTLDDDLLHRLNELTAPYRRGDAPR